jgi:hypothetical protein
MVVMVVVESLGRIDRPRSARLGFQLRSGYPYIHLLLAEAKQEHQAEPHHQMHDTRSKEQANNAHDHPLSSYYSPPPSLSLDFTASANDERGSEGPRFETLVPRGGQMSPIGVMPELFIFMNPWSSGASNELSNKTG